jgi:hypothetical protein
MATPLIQAEVLAPFIDFKIYSWTCARFGSVGLHPLSNTTAICAESVDLHYWSRRVDGT